MSRYVVLIVLPDGSEFDVGTAPRFGALDVALDEASRMALGMALIGDPASVVVRDEVTGSVEREFGTGH